MTQTAADRLFEDVIRRGIGEIRVRQIDVYTFAFYHDHESGAVELCVDTCENSARLVRQMNSFSRPHFDRAINQGDLRHAALWRANIGRSLSLGDFTLKHVARTPIGSLQADDAFYLSMIRSIQSHERKVIEMASRPDQLLFIASSSDDETGFFWPPLLSEGSD